MSTQFNNNVSEYPWYILVKPEEPLQQGDFIMKCPVLVPQMLKQVNSGNYDATIIDYNVIIMTQSCDLATQKIDLVLVCPFFTLDEIASKDSNFKRPEMKESLRRGYDFNKHLLNSCSLGTFNNDFLVVDFKNVFSVPFEFLNEYVKSIGDRVRLLPPYREHLSQAFARFFMRVGLPLDIPSFQK